MSTRALAGRLGALATAVGAASRLRRPLLNRLGLHRLRGLVGRDLADQLDDRLRRRGDLLRADGDTGPAQQLVGVAALLGQHDGDNVTRAAGAGGAPGAVQVGLVFGGRVDVDDQLHVVDVHAAGGDVGGDQHASFSRS